MFLVSNSFFSQNNVVTHDGYSTIITINQNTEVSFYSSTMFRLRYSKLNKDNYKKEYNIPFTIGYTNPWKEVSVSVIQQDHICFLNTEKLTIEFNTVTRQMTVKNKISGKQVYPSDGPIYGMFKDGYSMFDSASFFNEKNENRR